MTKRPMKQLYQVRCVVAKDGLKMSLDDSLKKINGRYDENVEFASNVKKPSPKHI